jgi:hypothetical protein
LSVNAQVLLKKPGGYATSRRGRGRELQRLPKVPHGGVKNFDRDFVDTVTHAFLRFCTFRPWDTLFLLYEREVGTVWTPDVVRLLLFMLLGLNASA